MNRLQQSQTVLVTVATLCMGFYFGSQFTGRQVITTYRGTPPEWLQTVRTANTVILGIFAVSILGVVAIERHTVNNEG